MGDFSGLFHDLERKIELPRTDVYYAYDMVVEGLKAYCKVKNTEPQWNEAYDQVVEWLKNNKGKGLLVYGDMGTGKSLLCRDIIPTILEKKYENQNNNAVCSSINAYDMAHHGTEDLVGYSRFIMIDDVGVEEDFNNYGTRRCIFSEIVDYAEENGRGLIITSNLNLQQMKDKYGVRTFDRLTSLVKPVIFKGESKRNRKSEKQPIPKRYRAYGMDFNSQEEADEFANEQRLLRDYISYGYAEINDKDIKEWHDGQPFRIIKHLACCIPKYEKFWKDVEWENDPDRLKYLEANFY